MTCEQAASWLIVVIAMWLAMRAILHILRMRFDAEPTMISRLSLPNNWMFTIAEKTFFREWRYTVECFRRDGIRLEVTVTCRDEDLCVSEVNRVVYDIENSF